MQTYTNAQLTSAMYTCDSYVRGFALSACVCVCVSVCQTLTCTSPARLRHMAVTAAVSALRRTALAALSCVSLA